MKFSLFILFYFLLNNFVFGKTICSKYIGTCQYYQCIENLENCGEKGYYLNFGYHYCQKYLDKTEKFSDKGKIFLTEIRKCLQEKIEDLSALPECSNVKDFAIKTHEECYQEKNYCDVTIVDKLRIQWVAKKEIFNQKFANFGQYLNDLCYPRNF